MISQAYRRPRRVLRAMVVLFHGDAEVAKWPLSTPDRLDLSVVNELARMQLAARRLGCSIQLRHVCPQLRRLLDLVGLRVEVGGEPENGEQVRVEEVVMPDDPVA
jgi:hypothetical protein